MLETPDEDALVASVLRRAVARSTRTDYADLGCPELGAPASADALEAAEGAIGVELHPFHRRLLLEVGNGGFGPGDGLIGLPGGRLDDDGRDAVELTEHLGGIPPGVLVLWEWGDSFWACVDERTGRLLTLTDSELRDSGVSLAEAMRDWALGVDLWEKLKIGGGGA